MRDQSHDWTGEAGDFVWVHPIAGEVVINVGATARGADRNAEKGEQYRRELG